VVVIFLRYLLWASGLVCFATGCLNTSSSKKSPVVSFDASQPQEVRVENHQGFICLGRVYSKAPVKGRDYKVRINSREYVWDPAEPAFVGPDRFPRDKELSAEIFVDDQLLQTFHFKIDSSISDTVTIYRSAGYYRVVQNSRNDCRSETLGYEINKKSGTISKNLRCYSYKVKSAKDCE